MFVFLSSYQALLIKTKTQYFSKQRAHCPGLLYVSVHLDITIQLGDYLGAQRRIHTDMWLFRYGVVYKGTEKQLQTFLTLLCFHYTSEFTVLLYDLIAGKTYPVFTFKHRAFLTRVYLNSWDLRPMPMSREFKATLVSPASTAQTLVSSLCYFILKPQRGSSTHRAAETGRGRGGGERRKRSLELRREMEANCFCLRPTLRSHPGEHWSGRRALI